MATRTSKVSSQEQDRQQLINELRTEHGPNWAEQYKPGSFGCHEFLDRTLLAAEIVEQYVLTHPACIRDREWYALAESAIAALQELYQKVGAEHLTDEQGTDNR